jgi:hypothetical protein
MVAALGEEPALRRLLVWRRWHTQTWAVRSGTGDGGFGPKRARVRRGGFRSSERVRRGFGPRLDRGAALTVWRTRGKRSRGSAPGGRCHPTSGPGTGLRATNQRAPHVRGFQISGKLKNTFPHKKNRYKVRKNLRKIMEVGNPIWRNFCDYNSLRFSMDFELFQRF